MPIFTNASNASQAPNPTNLEEGFVTSDVTSGVRYGSDPAKKVNTTVNTVTNIDNNTAGISGPNFDRFSVLDNPSAYNVKGNYFEAGQDLIPVAKIASTFGDTPISDEIRQVNVSNLLQNPGSEISTLAKNISSSVENEAKQAGKAAVRSVIQDVKDVVRGAINTLLNPDAAKDANLGVTDSRLSYAFAGPLDVHKSYVKGKPKDGDWEGMKGVEPLLNSHYVFRLNTVANKNSAGNDADLQSRLLLDKEFREGVSTEGKREVTLSAVLSKFSKTITPYRAADFLWLKYYNRIPLNRLVTLRRYMFPIDDSRQRSPYFDKNTKLQGWSNNPVSQMVTYFGGESKNSLSNILKVDVNIQTKPLDSKMQYVELFGGQPVDAMSILASSKTADVAKSAAGLLTKFLPSGVSSAITSAGSAAKLTSTDMLAGLLAYASVIDHSRATGLKTLQDKYNPYASGGYFSDLYQQPYNVVQTSNARVPGLHGGIGVNGISLTFEYSLKAIGHINAKAALLDIMANILATCHYRGTFWGGEARFFLNKGIFPLLDTSDTIKLVQAMWTGDYKLATETFSASIKSSFGDNFSPKAFIDFCLAQKNQNATPPSQNNEVVGETKGAATAQGEAAAGVNSNLNKLEEYAQMDLLSGMFGLTKGGGNPAIPSFQALKTGAPVGEWHLTVGNPFKPIAKIGNLICTGVSIELNDELGSDDFPTELKAVVKLIAGMPRANQDIESVFNDGAGALYYPKPTQDGTSFDSISADIAKQTGSSQLNDFLNIMPSSTLESVSENYPKIGQTDNSGDKTSSQIIRSEPNNPAKDTGNSTPYGPQPFVGPTQP